MPVSGMTGITVGEDGRPMGVVQGCEAPMDRAVLHVPAGPPEAEPEGSWSRSGTPDKFATWPLSGADGDGWTADSPPKPLVPRVTYRLYGATDDNSWSTGAVSFTPEDLSTLKPGQVRYATPSAPDVFTTGTLEDFRRAACEGE
ncbi:hypothetical protein GCM10010329_19510 [Streptomyces spiroverticillatus]|uniref:Uncharacterized protein n=2 Tax=Streptomyces finlayi TaxID=67296 RepID=A0A918WU51_9ACTN|nr:hypothetical protein GCM10010329_19510 [Streptomyces spiroverticillatus]GHC83156.1 hypothetical protein GCM10010334_11990 [Streptomyces finlayi]